MTREELDFIGSMNICDEISDEAYKKILCHCEGQQPHDDAVSRAGALKALECTIKDFELKEGVIKYIDDIVNLFNIIYKTQSQAIKALPPATLKNPSWHIAHGMIEDRFWCSCGYIRIMDSNMIEWKYCPVCGGTREVLK